MQKKRKVLLAIGIALALSASTYFAFAPTEAIEISCRNVDIAPPKSEAEKTAYLKETKAVCDQVANFRTSHLFKYLADRACQPSTDADDCRERMRTIKTSLPTDGSGISIGELGKSLYWNPVPAGVHVFHGKPYLEQDDNIGLFLTVFISNQPMNVRIRGNRVLVILS